MKRDTVAHTALRAFIARYRFQKDAAAALAISPQYLTDILHGRREFSATLLGALGYERIVMYRLKRKPGDPPLRRE